MTANLALTLESRLAEVLELTEGMAADFGLTRRERAMLTAPLFLLLCDLEEAEAAPGDEQGDDPPAAPPGTIVTPAYPWLQPFAVPPFDLRGATWTAAPGPSFLQQRYVAGVTPGQPGYLRTDVTATPGGIPETSGAIHGGAPTGISTAGAQPRHLRSEYLAMRAEQPEQPAPRVAVVPDPRRELTPVEAAALAQVLNEEAVVPRPRLVLMCDGPGPELYQFASSGAWGLNDRARAEMVARGESPDDYLAGLNAGSGDVTP